MDSEIDRVVRMKLRNTLFKSDLDELVRNSVLIEPFAEPTCYFVREIGHLDSNRLRE